MRAKTLNSDSGYGIVFDASGQNRPVDVGVENMQQEHGFLTAGSGTLPLTDLPIGGQVQSFPNHVCMITAPYDRYDVVTGGDEVIQVWGKTTGW